MARRRKGLLAAKMRQHAQLKVRLPEALRFQLELAAEKADRSMNAEIVRRLSESIQAGQDSAAIAAEAILNGLDQEIVEQIEDMILRANAEKEVRTLYRKDADSSLDLAPKADTDPDAGGVINLVDALRGMLGRAPTFEELRAVRRSASQEPTATPRLGGKS